MRQGLFCIAAAALLGWNLAATSLQSTVPSPLSLMKGVKRSLTQPLDVKQRQVTPQDVRKGLPPLKQLKTPDPKNLGDYPQSRLQQRLC